MVVCEDENGDRIPCPCCDDENYDFRNRFSGFGFSFFNPNRSNKVVIIIKTYFYLYV